jgi:hypothetical protein
VCGAPRVVVRAVADHRVGWVGDAELTRVGEGEAGCTGLGFVAAMTIVAPVLSAATPQSNAAKRRGEYRGQVARLRSAA